MSKRKHQQNQLEKVVEVTNCTNTNSQKNESQTDATNPQEHGRSMTEMLGVLAIIGVLSIGGVQGYRYAMNKYHSNEVINELNILNAQLAIFMSGIHNDEAVMSLGEPYDNAEKINAGGYAFTYGCGQDPDSMSPCELDETGYFMTLSGIPEDVCKSASQMTANMLNLVEQRVNGHTDNDGILCQDGDNQLTFLFDANDGQGFENGNDEDENENGNNPEVPATPENEDEDEQIVTTIVTSRPENGDCSEYFGYKKVPEAEEYCRNRGGVVKLDEIGCTMTTNDTTGKRCDALKNFVNKGYYVVGNYPPSQATDDHLDAIYKHCPTAYSIFQEAYFNGPYIGWGNSKDTPLCWDDYRRGNSEVTAAYTETAF